eukprot:gene22792-24054_t
MFFSPFILIAVLKLLLFSVFQMRMVLAVYQARYSMEGNEALRRRLLIVHLVFYTVAFLVFYLLIYVSVARRPLAGVFLLYSFWLPQIVYSAVTGTKPSMQIPYVLGTTLTRLFVPLYILGCPNSIFIQIYHFLDSSPSPLPSSSLPLSSLPVHLSGEQEACLVLVAWLTLQVLVVVQLPQTHPQAPALAGSGWTRYKFHHCRNIERDKQEENAASNICCNCSHRNSSSGSSIGEDGNMSEDMELRILLNPSGQTDEESR